jgi:ADP-dependent NAD(P)H-hydrate dehydratase
MTEQNHLFSPAPRFSAVALPDLARLRRRADVDKFGCGRVVVIGGATGMAGAPALSAMAALRSGAGLVELHVPESVVSTAATFSPCVMTHGHPATHTGTFSVTASEPLLERGERGDVVACGPGLGRNADTVHLVQRLWQECPVPTVFDADALWALSQIDRGTLAQHAAPRVLTPHGGELLRFLDPRPASSSPQDRPPRDELEREASALAADLDAVVVLKGPQSLVTDGSHQWHNTSGNAGMATAGSGDVLTGVIAALSGGGLAVLSAAHVGVWAHGYAGDVAASRLSQTSLIATDLLDHLPHAFRCLEQFLADGHWQAAPSA